MTIGALTWHFGLLALLALGAKETNVVFHIVPKDIAEHGFVLFGEVKVATMGMKFRKELLTMADGRNHAVSCLPTNLVGLI